MANNNHDARISCEETFTEDMGPATWANEPEPQSEPRGRCEDAPCCGCCEPSDLYEHLDPRYEWEADFED